MNAITFLCALLRERCRRKKKEGSLTTNFSHSSNLLFI